MCDTHFRASACALAFSKAILTLGSWLPARSSAMPLRVPLPHRGVEHPGGADHDTCRGKGPLLRAKLWSIFHLVPETGVPAVQNTKVLEPENWPPTTVPSIVSV